MNPLPQKKPTILLCDHACHDRTRSFDFFQKLLTSKGFRVFKHRYERFYRYGLTKEELAEDPVLLYHQFPPGRFRLGHPGHRAVWIPMYDGDWGSKWLWRKVALWGLPVIAFSRRQYAEATKARCQRVLPLHYFPDPRDYQGMRGDPKVLFLWERGQADFRLIRKLFGPGDFREIILLRHPEDCLQNDSDDDAAFKAYRVTLCEKPYLPRSEFLELLSRAGVFMAPRLREGIGHPFLEALAMGKVVIAHRDGTMDEYIQHGVNGWLVDYRHPQPLPVQTIQALHASLPDPMPCRKQWESEAAKVADFLLQTPRLKPLSPFAKGKDCLYNLLMIGEYLCYRMKERMGL